MNTKEAIEQALSLTEARVDRYRPMLHTKALDWLYSYDSTYADYAEDILNTAVEGLKRDDRIVWYLVQVKRWLYSIIQRALEREERDAYAPETMQEVDYYKDIYEKEWAKFTRKYGDHAGTPNLPRIRGQLERYLSLGCEALNAYVFDVKKSANETLAELWEIEQDYYTTDKAALTPAEDEEKVIEYPDGSAWFRIPRPECTEVEGQIMQHCGNRYANQDPDDEIFAYRMKSNAEGAYAPKLTFVVNNGRLKEAKGKQNTKPSAKYHDVIVDLLLSGRIDKIDYEGSHALHDNFSIDDLSGDLKEKFESQWDGEVNTDAKDYAGLADALASEISRRGASESLRAAGWTVDAEYDGSLIWYNSASSRAFYATPGWTNDPYEIPIDSSDGDEFVDDTTLRMDEITYESYMNAIEDYLAQDT